MVLLNQYWYSSQSLEYPLYQRQLKQFTQNNSFQQQDKTIYGQIQLLNSYNKEQKYYQQDCYAESLHKLYIDTIEFSGICETQTPIALLNPDKFFWYHNENLYCLGTEIQLQKKTSCEKDKFEFKYNDRMLAQLASCYGIYEYCLIKAIFNALGHFLSKTRYTDYHEASQSLKWNAGVFSLPFCESPYRYFFLYKERLYCYTDQRWRILTTDALKTHLQQGTKVCWDYRAKMKWVTELSKLPQIWAYSSEVFSGKIILNFDNQSCTLVKYLPALERFEYEYPILSTCMPHGRYRNVPYSGDSPDLPLYPSEKLREALFLMCGGRISTLNSIAELFAGASIEEEPSKHLWILSGQSCVLNDFVITIETALDRRVDSVNYDKLFNRAGLERLLEYDVFGKWGLYEHRNSFVLGRKKSKLRALINGELIDSFEDELCGEIKVSSRMQVIIGTNDADAIETDIGDIPHRIIEMEFFIRPDINPRSYDALWLKTMFTYHGMQIVQGTTHEQKSSTGDPLQVFVKKFCKISSDLWYDGKLFYDKYSRWLKSVHPEVAIAGSTKFLNSVVDILGVKYETYRRNNNRKTLVGISIDEEKCESEILDTSKGIYSFEDFCAYLNSFEKYNPIDPLASPSSTATISMKV